jgi:hypothetical protein
MTFSLTDPSRYRCLEIPDLGLGTGYALILPWPLVFSPQFVYLLFFLFLFLPFVFCTLSVSLL